jgi:acetaldehyde dehydrogenase (acetylating)
VRIRRRGKAISILNADQQPGLLTRETLFLLSRFKKNQEEPKESLESRKRDENPK